MKDMPGLKQMMSSMGLSGLGGGSSTLKIWQIIRNKYETKQKEAMRKNSPSGSRLKTCRTSAANANIKQTDDGASKRTDENSNPSTPLKIIKNPKIRIKKKRRLGKKK